MRSVCNMKIWMFLFLSLQDKLKTIKSTVKKAKSNRLFLNTVCSICGTRKTISKLRGYQDIMSKGSSVR